MISRSPQIAPPTLKNFKFIQSIYEFFLFNKFVLNVLQVQTKQHFQENLYIRMGSVSLALMDQIIKQI